jgi:hypothetical protein
MRIVLLLILLAGCQPSQPTEILCGGAMNFACPPDMYCHLNEDCGGIDREGVCRPRPLKCKPEEKPVCGCDDESYQNACFAAAKGVTPKSEGRCSAEPE